MSDEKSAECTITTDEQFESCGQYGFCILEFAGYFYVGLIAYILRSSDVLLAIKVSSYRELRDINLKSSPICIGKAIGKKRGECLFSFNVCQLNGKQSDPNTSLFKSAQETVVITTDPKLCEIIKRCLNEE
ncbi:MAG: hypothetical protein WC648_03790 [Candidatus Paceibacterota bacterium]|jgi:hypothetical protein